ncbi:hypothetical protein ACM1RC_27905 [Paenibacillus azoreducens]|uniref:hypothetical protein n=1 Tax=Paenibacillus azoreducens TaxID=116718 RepID=UPI0039F63B88
MADANWDMEEPVRLDPVTNLGERCCLCSSRQMASAIRLMTTGMNYTPVNELGTDSSRSSTAIRDGAIVLRTASSRFGTGLCDRDEHYV